jgi:hypothetical protein
LNPKNGWTTQHAHKSTPKFSSPSQAHPAKQRKKYAPYAQSETNAWNSRTETMNVSEFGAASALRITGGNVMTPRKKILETEYVLSEAEWLLSFGVHPEVVAAQLGRKPETIYQLAVRHQHETVMGGFTNYVSAERERRHRERMETDVEYASRYRARKRGAK